MPGRHPKPPPPPASIPYEGIESGAVWTPALTRTADTQDTLTVLYSFPQLASDYGKPYSEANKFVAFSAPEAAAFRPLIALVTSYTQLNLVQNTTPGADGLADIRIGKTVTPGADAWAYYPGTGKGGDAWFDRNDSGAVFGGKGGMDWDHLQPGGYTYTVFMHEFGHSLGLKHPFEQGGIAGAVPKAYDSIEYTVMSYDAYQTITPYDPASTYDPAVDQRNWWADTGSNPQTYMMLDIAALQNMYGADFGTNNTNTTYMWSPVTGAMSINGVSAFDAPGTPNIFMTIWDGGGTDTYNFSNYTLGVSIDLNPGYWVAIDYQDTDNPFQRADLLAGDGTHFAVGNIANALIIPGVNNDASHPTAGYIENAVGGAGDDVLIGNVKANMLTGGAGSDMLTGGGGNDSFVLNSLVGVDTIIDFGPGLDHLLLDDAVFTELDASHLANELVLDGSEASDGNDYLLYDAGTGQLSYDADANGSGDPIQVALLGNHPTLTSADFLLA